MTAPGAGTAGGRPNVLVICTDQQRYDALGCYGNPVIETPHVDALAAAGTVFERCYTPSPVCAPGRASVLLGQYPHRHGLWANGVALPGGRPLLGRLLADAGYECGLAGRCHLSAAYGGRDERRFDDGFTTFAWANDPPHASSQNAYHRWFRAHFPDLWQQERARAARGAGPGLCVDVPTEAHYSRWLAEETIDFLRRPREPDRPFFFLANFHDPHPPFVAPKEYLDRYRDAAFPAPLPPPGDDGRPAVQRGLSEGTLGRNRGFTQHTPEELRELVTAYYAMVSLVDDEVGRILRTLDDLGLADDTLVLFTSDHGEMLGDHGLLLKGPLFYEGAVRVPLVARWPGRVPAGHRVPQLVQTLDLFSTVLAAAGVSEPADTQARDLLATGGAVGRGWALCEYRDSGDPLEPPVHASMLLDGRHKLVVHHRAPGADTHEGELYDLAADPGELRNRWSDPRSARVRRRLTEQLVDVLVDTEDRSAPREAPW